MSLSRIATHGPSAIASGAISVTYTGTAGANNLLIMYVISFGAQTFPATIAGFGTLETTGSGAGYTWARYSKVAAGTETGSQAVMTATVPSLALITEWDSSTTTPYPYITSGFDISDAADGLTIAGSSITSHNGDVIEVIGSFSLSTPSYPSVPAGPTGRAITQAGATLGTITNRAGATWQTNHRYNISDIPVTTGATGVPSYVHSSSLTNMRGLMMFTVISETSPPVGTPATATVPAYADNIVIPIPGIEVTTALSVETPGIPITTPIPVVSGGVVVSPPTLKLPIVVTPPTIVLPTTSAVGRSLQVVFDVQSSPLVVGKSLTLVYGVKEAVAAQVKLLWNTLAVEPVTQYSLEIDGLNMRTEAWNVSTLTGRASMPSLRGDDLQIPGRSGYYFIPNKPSDAGLGALAVWVVGKNSDGTIPPTQTGRVAQFRANFALMQRIFMRKHRLSTVRAGQTDGSFRVAHVQWVEWSEPEITAGGTRADWSMGFSIPDVFWTDEETRAQSTSASATLPKNLDLTQFSDMTGVIEDSIISVTGPITNPRVTDAETGHYIELIGTLTSSEVWVLDAGASTSLKNGVSMLMNTRHAGSYRFFTISNLYGLSGTPRLTLTGTGGGVTTRLGMSARRKWISG